MDNNDLDEAYDGDLTEQLSIVVSGNDVTCRLDHLLIKHSNDISRSRIISSIKTGLILVDGEQRKPSYKVKEGESVTGTYYVPPQASVEPEYIEFPVLFEDDAILVISKPPGLVVHPGSGVHNGTLVNGLVHYCNEIKGVGDTIRPGIVHRLDKDTSGLMIVAKNDKVHQKLVDAFKAREIHKEYLALVHSVPDQDYGRIVASIGRHPISRQKMAIRESGRYAVSNWEVVDTYSNRYSLLKVHIETGRTHQIRVHMASIKHPVAGDTVYGSNRNNRPFPRQLLHAWKLSFNHPLTGAKMKFRAPIWDDMQEIIEQLENEENIA